MPVAPPRLGRPARVAAAAAPARPGYDARRGSAAARGYDRQWQSYRLVYLVEHPLCVRCLGRGQTASATVVDHVAPHGGDLGLFWDAANHQALCKPCHDRKTAAEDGGFRRDAVNWHPGFLRPSKLPLTVVCGPPGSGKTTWVSERSAQDDVVVDLDLIGAELCGTGPHDWPRDRLNEIGRERNRRLMALAKARPGSGRRAWFALLEPAAERRQWWVDTMMPVRVVVLEVEAYECMRRLAADPTRPRARAWQEQVVADWWRRYRRRPGDEVVRHTPKGGV